MEETTQHADGRKAKGGLSHGLGRDDVPRTGVASEERIWGPWSVTLVTDRDRLFVTKRRSQGASGLLVP